jgi:hypothetical protein
MLATSLFTPVFVQVMLTFFVIVWVGRTRRQSLAQSRTSIDDRDLSLGRHPWSEAATQAANNFKNQFEMPVLFYIGVAFALILRKTDVLLVALAWAFVISRIVHALIHLGPNVVRWRSLAYIIGVICLLAFWIALFLRVYGDGALA